MADNTPDAATQTTPDVANPTGAAIAPDQPNIPSGPVDTSATTPYGAAGATPVTPGPTISPAGAQARRGGGILGGILVGALTGAAAGMTAQTGGAAGGAAASQKKTEEDRARADKLKQQAIENQQQAEQHKAQIAMWNMQTLKDAHEMAHDDEEHPIRVQGLISDAVKKGADADAAVLGTDNIRQAKAQADANLVAAANSAGIEPVATYGGSSAPATALASATPPATFRGKPIASSGPTPAQTQEILSTPNTAKPTTAADRLTQMRNDAKGIVPQLATGKLIAVGNGKTGAGFQVHVFQPGDLDKPITDDRYVDTVVGWDAKNNKPLLGAPTLFQADGKTTVRQLGMAVSAFKSQADDAFKKYNTQNMATLDAQKAAAETLKDKAEAANQESQAELAHSQASGKNLNVPPTFRPDPNVMSMSFEDANAMLQKQGVELPKDANNLYALAHYRADSSKLYPTRVSPKSGQKDAQTAFSQATALYNPGLDQKEYNARYHYLQDYESGKGADGANRRRLSTAAGHLATLQQVSDILAQGSGASQLQALNQIAQKIGVATGDSVPVVYQAVANKAAAEAAAAFKGGTAAPTDPEIEKAGESFSSTLAPNIRQANIQAQYALLQTQVDTLAGAFQQEMGQTPDQLNEPILFGSGAEAMKKNTGQGIAGEKGNAKPRTAADVPQGKIPAYDKTTGAVVGYADDNKGTNYKPF